MERKYKQVEPTESLVVGNYSFYFFARAWQGKTFWDWQVVKNFLNPQGESKKTSKFSEWEALELIGATAQAMQWLSKYKKDKEAAMQQKTEAAKVNVSFEDDDIPF